MRDWKVALESLVKEEAGSPSQLYIQSDQRRRPLTNIWVLGSQQHTLAKDPLFHSSFTQQRCHNKELKVGKMTLEPILSGRVWSKWRVCLHEAMGERGIVLGQAVLA
jgi:hypothetical protein